MQPPAPVLTGLLGDAGYPYDEAQVATALGAEIAHYRAHMQMGRDAEGLAALRAECAGVLVASLGSDAPPLPRATELLVECLQFSLFDDVLPALDTLAEMGLALGVVSNWDCALPHHLERLGVADRFGVICASAAVGHRKPDPGIFAVALSALDVPPGAALHVGDQYDEDVIGAQAAGVSALLLDRRPDVVPHGDVITALTQVPGRAAA
jgi:FMN phosphatase YigB (HAD superfamily)